MLYELIDMNTWKTKKELIKELNSNGCMFNERTFRKAVKNHNKLFYEHITDKFIAHSNKGYKVTTDREEILESLKDNHKRALDMLYDESRTKNALGEKINFKLLVNERGFFVVEK